MMLFVQRAVLVQLNLITTGMMDPKSDRLTPCIRICVMISWNAISFIFAIILCVTIQGRWIDSLVVNMLTVQEISYHLQCYLSGIVYHCWGCMVDGSRQWKGHKSCQSCEQLCIKCLIYTWYVLNNICHRNWRHYHVCFNCWLPCV